MPNLTASFDVEQGSVVLDGITPSFAVALPPSTLDPAPDIMRVYVNGTLIGRPYDTDVDQ